MGGQVSFTTCSILEMPQREATSLRRTWCPSLVRINTKSLVGATNSRPRVSTIKRYVCCCRRLLVFSPLCAVSVCWLCSKCGVPLWETCYFDAILKPWISSNCFVSFTLFRFGVYKIFYHFITKPVLIPLRALLLTNKMLTKKLCLHLISLWEEAFFFLLRVVRLNITAVMCHL